MQITFHTLAVYSGKIYRLFGETYCLLMGENYFRDVQGRRGNVFTEDGDSTFLQKVGKLKPDYTVSQYRRRYGMLTNVRISDHKYRFIYSRLNY
jgi:hypothetical protein